MSHPFADGRIPGRARSAGTTPQEERVLRRFTPKGKICKFDKPGRQVMLPHPKFTLAEEEILDRPSVKSY
jgi:hypothetical protein